MAALLTIESQNTDKLAMYLGECRELGVPVLPPDVNRSEWRFTVEPDGVRYGLGAVKNVGEGAIASMLGVPRGTRAGITSLFTLAEQLDLRLVNKRVLESLVKAGAFDEVGRARRCGQADAARASCGARLLASVDRDPRTRQPRPARSRARASRSSSAADVVEGRTGRRRPARRGAAASTEAQQLSAEKEALGPLPERPPDPAVRRGSARLRRAAASADLAGVAKPTSRSAASSRACAVKTRKGDRMATFMLEDDGGALEVVVYPGNVQAGGGAHRERRDGDRAGQVREGRGHARACWPSELLPIVGAARARHARGGHPPGRAAARPLHVRGPRRTCSCSTAATAACSLELEVRSGGRPLRVRADLAGLRVRPSERLVADVERICGAGTVNCGEVHGSRDGVASPAFA